MKSFSPDVTFENGLSEIVVDVDELERFEVTAYIEMKESSETEDYHFAFIPEPPFLNWMKTGKILCQCRYKT